MYDYIAFSLPFFSFILIYGLTKYYINFAKKRGLLVPDAHKKDKPLIPTMGGVVLFSLIPLYLIAYLFLSDYTVHRSIPLNNELIAIISVIMISGLIGLIDDLKDLGLKKVFASIFVTIPILFFHAYYPRLMVPFVGRIRITIVYPILILLAVPIVVNAVNMVDTHNGVMLSASAFILAPLLLWSIILGDKISILYISVALGAVLGLFIWNKYPARVFPGNVGSYLLGGLLIVLIIITGMEYVALVAMLPIILHGFYLLSSIRGIMTRQKIRMHAGKPVFLKGEVIYPNLDPNAPFTLTRLLIIAFGPMTEKELVRKFYLLFGFSSFLAFITGFIVYML